MKRCNISILALICPAMLFFTSVYGDDIKERRKAWLDIVATCKYNHDLYLYEDIGHMLGMFNDMNILAKTVDVGKVKEVEEVLDQLDTVVEALKKYAVVETNKAALDKKRDESTIKNYEEARATFHKDIEADFPKLVEAQEKILAILNSITSNETVVKNTIAAILAFQKLRRYDASLAMMEFLLPLNKDAVKELHKQYTEKSAGLSKRIAALENEYSTMAREYTQGTDNLRAMDEKLGEIKDIEKDMIELNCSFLRESKLITKKYWDVDGKNAAASVRNMINLISGRAVAGNKLEDVAKICDVSKSEAEADNKLLVILLSALGAFALVTVGIVVIVLVYKRRRI